MIKGITQKICRLCFCPNKYNSFEPFMCLNQSHNEGHCVHPCIVCIAQRFKSNRQNHLLICLTRPTSAAVLTHSSSKQSKTAIKKFSAGTCASFDGSVFSGLREKHNAEALSRSAAHRETRTSIVSLKNIDHACPESISCKTLSMHVTKTNTV